MYGEQKSSGILSNVDILYYFMLSHQLLRLPLVQSFPVSVPKSGFRATARTGNPISLLMFGRCNLWQSDICAGENLCFSRCTNGEYPKIFCITYFNRLGLFLLENFISGRKTYCIYRISYFIVPPSSYGFFYWITVASYGKAAKLYQYVMIWTF